MKEWLRRIGEGKNRFDELTAPGFAMWGGVAGLMLGTASAAGTLAILRGETDLV